MTRTHAARVASSLLALLISTHVSAESGALAAGHDHACRITPQDGVECWGLNSGASLADSSGQLGDGTATNRPTPGPVLGLPEPVRTIAAGEEHTCALTISGAMYCWGDNHFGQMGDGGTVDKLVATRVAAFTQPVLQISAGGYHTCALVAPAREVYCWGDNSGGQVGEAGTIGTDALLPLVVASLGTNVTSVDAGGGHTCALLPTGEVRCWGRNDFGGLGRSGPADENPTTVANLVGTIESLALGDAHSCALNADGGVMCWGRGSDGQLGDGASTQSDTPVQVAGLASGVRSIALGGGFSCAVTFTGAGVCWGYNVRGALGVGGGNRATPNAVPGFASGVQAFAGGSEFACALDTSGAASCTGNNTYGQLGDGTTNDRFGYALVVNATRGIVTAGVTLRGAAMQAADELEGAAVAIGEDDADETIAVGAPGTADGGTVYVYVRAVGSTSRAPLDRKAAAGAGNGPARALTAPAGGGIGDKFGRAIATSPDGGTIVVGAPLRNGNGSVFVYRRPVNGWDDPVAPTPTEIPAPLPADGLTAEQFGDAIAYAPDGTLVIGAPASDVASAVDAGAAFAYADNGTQLVPLNGGVLTATVPSANAHFGDAVAGEDGTLAVGAPDEGGGSVYTMPKNGAGVGPATRLTAAGGQIGDKFGSSVGVDRGTLVVGAPGDDTAAGTNSGSARVFGRDGGNAWTETSTLTPNAGDDQGAGEAVAVRNGTIVVGAPLASAYDKPGAGRGYLYRFDQEQLAGEAGAEAVLAGGANDQFGRAIAITRRRIGVGVPNARALDADGDVQANAGRTDTFLLDGIFRAEFE